jgi:hypothetical protein
VHPILSAPEVEGLAATMVPSSTVKETVHVGDEIAHAGAEALGVARVPPEIERLAREARSTSPLIQGDDVDPTRRGRPRMPVVEASTKEVPYAKRPGPFQGVHVVPREGHY